MFNDMESKAKESVLSQIVALMDDLEAKGLKGSLELESGKNEAEPDETPEDPADDDLAKLKALAE